MSFSRNNEDWRALAEAVREELRESAWLLSLMDSQQRAILSRDPDALADASKAIEDQAAEIARVAASSSRVRTQLSDAHIPHGDASFEKLIEHAPPPMIGLFIALREEGAALKSRLERRARQNQGLLKRAQALGAELLEGLEPSGSNKTYTRSGSLKKSASLRGSVVRTAV